MIALPAPLEIIGPVKVIAHVATSAADTDITAKLVDVHPGGFAQRLCDGMVRLRYRDGFQREQAVVPGEVYEVEIALWDTCVRLPAGHRLRVEIASSAFPKYDVNLGTGGDMISETTGLTATNRLWHTPARPSRLILNQPPGGPPRPGRQGGPPRRPVRTGQSGRASQGGGPGSVSWMRIARNMRGVSRSTASRGSGTVRNRSTATPK